MSLRGRLTLLYTSLVGGILLLFGVAVYVAVSITITTQIDSTLKQTFMGVLQKSYIGGVWQLAPWALQDLPADVYVQVWNTNGTLQTFSANISQMDAPMDRRGLYSSESVLRDTYIHGVHLRVLSVPLVMGKRLVGVMQVGTQLTLVDNVQRSLVIVLLLGVVIATSAAGLAVWLGTRQAMASLQDVTQVALQITRADDLSRRIPYNGSPDDEVGHLILAFNQTLGRLENLFHSQRRFMADVGHELRTPLTVVRGNVDLMRKIGMDEDALCSIESKVDRLTRLVGDLLLLAQAESGKIPLDHRLVELDTVVLEVLNQMRVLARDKLTLRLGDFDQVLVCGDRDRLKQVLVNLIGNAIQYTPPGGEVVVGLGKTGSQTCLTISDNGPGIPQDDVPHIFERFYRGEKARTRSKDGKGFGLGLSIAYWIVRHHGGRIEVNSMEGRGTTFAVWLALADGNCSS